MKNTICTAAAIVACAASLTSSSLQRSALQPSTVKAFTGFRLIDGTDRAPVDNAAIVVRDGRIAAIGRKASVPKEATVVALDGKFVIPGLVNAHGHVGDTAGLQGNHYSAENVIRDLRLYAAYGVTTVVSLGGDQRPGFDARDAQSVPTLDRARLFLAGPVLVPNSPDDAKRLVAEDDAIRVDVVKIRVDDNLGTTPKMPPDIYSAVITEAHRRGMRVAVHLFYLADARAVVDLGADFIAHSVRDAEIDPALIAAMKLKRTCYCPTLMREVSTYVYESTPSFFSDPFFLKHADPKVVEALKDPGRQQAMRTSPAAQRYKAALEMAMKNLKLVSDAGIPIAMGTDTGPPARFQGYFEQMELEMMARAGLSPKQVLAAATRDAARCSRLDREVGTLEPGKWADFIALDADPLADIRNTRTIDSVWIAGNRVGQ